MHSFRVLLCIAVGFGLAGLAISPAAAQTTNATDAGNATTNDTGEGLLDDISEEEAEAIADRLSESKERGDDTLDAIREEIEGDDQDGGGGDQADGQGQNVDNSSNSDQSGDDLEAPPGFQFQLTDTTRLNDWSYNTESEEFTITFTLDAPARVNMAEAMNPEESGVTGANVRSDLMPPGRHTIRFAASPGASGEAALTFSTPNSVELGRVAYISTGDTSENPFKSFGGTSGLFSGIGISMGLAALAAVFVVWREERGVIEA